MYLALMLSRKNLDINVPKNLLLALLPVGFIEGLILKEPDFGTFVLILAITLIMLYVSGLRLKYFFVFFLLLVPLLISDYPQRPGCG